MLETEFAACSRLLRELTGVTVQVIELESLGSQWAPVERLCFDADYPPIGQSVVVKARRHHESGWGGSPANLLTEHRALTFLRDLDSRVAPELLAFDEQVGVLIMSDISHGHLIERVLFDSDPIHACAALIAMAVATASMHGASTTIGGEVWNTSSLFGQGLEQHWQVLVTEVARLGFPEPDVAIADVCLLFDAMTDKGWRTLTHGDLHPGNAIQCHDGVRLIDFEGAGPRHVFLDAANFRLPFPAYGHWATIPDGVLKTVDDAYRTELSRGMPRAEVDHEYGKGMSTGCTVWTLLRLSRLGVIAAGDQGPADALRRRSQIVQTIESCVATAGQTRSYPALMSWFNAVSDEMRQRWPEANEQPRQFPAFASKSA